MRLVFMGTAAFAVPSVYALASSPHDILAVVTQPDRQRGRGHHIQSSPVKVATEALGLELHQPTVLDKGPFRGWIEQVRPDALVVVAYGKLLRGWLIGLPPRGVVNLHASLLPKYRGAAPVPWAIARGEVRTGVCTMQIDEGLDTGPVYACRETEIGPEETAPELTGRLAHSGAGLLVETIGSIEAGVAQLTPQRSQDATVAPKLRREDGYVRWEEPAHQIHDKIRAFLPWPSVVVSFRGQRCRLLSSRIGRIGVRDGDPGEIEVLDGRLFVRCGDSRMLEILLLQLENRKIGSGCEFVNGFRPGTTESFASLAEEGRDVAVRS